MMRTTAALCLFWVGWLGMGAQQTPPAEPQSTPAFTAPEQRAQFEAAKKAYAAGLWGDALAALKPLHQALPEDADLTRFTAECALDMGDPAYALALVAPAVEDKPGNWQERMLMARAYAEMHDDAKRDAALQSLMESYASGRHAKLNTVQQFLVERVALSKGHMDIYYSLAPWSGYNIYEMGRVINAAGQLAIRLTLESGDGDQPLWARQHAKEAAQGMREFSMDGYTDQFAAGGQHTQTHFTFGFFDGRPSYNAVRDKMTAIAEGKAGPMSSRSGIPVQ